MKEEAIQLYKLATTIEFELGTISVHEYYLRLIALLGFSNNSENIRKYIYDFFGECDLENLQYIDESNEELLGELRKGNKLEEKNLNRENDNRIYFTTQQSGKFSKWKFTLGDPDYFPSIPHGHSLQNNKIKLDCYLGHFYNVKNKNTKSVLIGRESRQYIIDLWNDSNFRIFALDHINWFIRANRNFTWRVPNHRRKILPKRR